MKYILALLKTGSTVPSFANTIDVDKTYVHSLTYVVVFVMVEAV